MNIKDCRINMKVECQTDAPIGVGAFNSPIKKGDVVTIRRINTDINVINFKEQAYGWYARDFEPANEYEIGDKVIYDNHFKKYKAEILVFVNKQSYTGTVGIRYKDNHGHWNNKFVNPLNLSHLKKPDKLEVGDKFISSSIKFEILAVGYDNKQDCVDYYVKYREGKFKGSTTTKWSTVIDKIIYE